MSRVRDPIAMVRGVPVVAAPEEIDASNAERLETIVLRAAFRGHGRFVVDMTGTRFCASAGLSVLVRAHNRTVAEGGQVRLVIPATAASIRRIFQITGIDHLIPNFTDLEQALEPAPAAAAQPRRRRRRSKPGMRTRANRQPPEPGPKTRPA